MTKLLGDQYASSINFKVFPGSEINPVVFTINKLSIEHPAHNLTEEIALFISNFEGFNEAPIKQIVEIIPTGKAALLGSQCCHDFMLLFQTLVYVNKKKMKTR